MRTQKSSCAFFLSAEDFSEFISHDKTTCDPQQKKKEFGHQYITKWKNKTIITTSRRRQ